MASANIQTWSSVPEDYFSCSICLDVFTEPVSTPCGHNYCKGCITGYWASRDSSQCPLCKAEFRKTPVLQVNTEFRDMLELFKKTKPAADVKSSPPMVDEVFCDPCHGMKRKALKSCLVCLASYCNGHLRPHRSVQALKWHKLINPVKNLENRMCRKHNKVLEFFCKEDQSCVCVLCFKDHHVMHEAISLDEEFKGRKNKVKNVKREVKQSLSNKHGMIQAIQNSMKQGREELGRTKAETATAFDALVALVMTKKITLIELLEEKQKEAEQRAESLIRQLQLEIVEDNRLSDKLKELSETEDDFRLLQDLPAVPSPSNINYPVTESAQRLLETETVKKAVAKMVKTLDEQMEIITGEVNMVKGQQTKSGFDDELGIIQSQHAVNLALNPDTAHPCLIVSEDRKEVRDGGTKTRVPDNPMRFDSLRYVLGDEGFSSGTFYFEIKLNGQTRWEVGMARESISRKGVDLSLSPENGCWTLGCYWGRYQANTNPPVILSLSNGPEKIGVFVDYEGGLVSFYDVDTRALIYSFSGCAFTESAPFLRNVLSLRLYGGAPSKTKIYPLFRPDAEQGSTSLQIIPV
ncbi:E3 ubiquitin-protein ligase TRIM39-like [Cheilinus undulatus]|uniref:E3 ubiquitin-protein ligase TRIM39-like n=1 Tax=Cheilinus undulatus TaxID=241271 RepID=UPI001BD2260B|nr:E3 ubiquitin-protein ligase TRIM39-like [Cheilinus undulatus]